MNMSKEEVSAIMSLAKKIIQHENDKEWLQDLQDESDAEWNSEEYVQDEDSDLETIRKSEDQGDSYG